jgi:hypothetical protein
MAETGRKGNGQFDKGWKGGVNQSPAIVRGVELRDAYQGAVSIKDMRAIAERLVGIALHSKDERNAIAAATEVFNRCIGKSPEFVVGDTHNHIGQMLFTNSADALKYVADQSDEDVMRGVKCLPNPNGKGKRKPRGSSK